MPKTRKSVSRTKVFRGEPYSNLSGRVPLPDLVALHQNGTLFSDTRAMTESATEEEGAQILKSAPGRELSATATKPLPHLQPTNRNSQTEKDNLPNSEDGHDISSHLPENEHPTSPATPSNPHPHPNIHPNHPPSSDPSTQKTNSTSNSASPYSLRQRRRGLPNLRIITSPTHLASLKTKNLNNPISKIPLLESQQPEPEIQAANTTPAPQFQNPLSQSQRPRNNSRDQDSRYHNRKLRNHYAPNPPRQQRKIRLRTNVPPHPRTRFSFISESPDTCQQMSNPIPNPGLHSSFSNRIIPSTLSPSPPPSIPHLLPPPLSNPITSTQYISAILALRASTLNPDSFPLPPGIQHFWNMSAQQQHQNKNKNKNVNRSTTTTMGKREIDFLALQMEQVEDAIQLEGAPGAAREVYYAQFARGEY
ncbi:hypothetical protein EAE96_008906 [Botrytis aclada]|nr:hypothetical protein EAE96_008906 [Botrytis aclada]